MSDSPAFALLEARHVDALTEALHATTRAITQQAARDTRILAALEQIAAHTANLPALMAALARSSNGHGNTDDNVDAG